MISFQPTLNLTSFFNKTTIISSMMHNRTSFRPLNDVQGIFYTQIKKNKIKKKEQKKF